MTVPSYQPSVLVKSVYGVIGASIANYASPAFVDPIVKIEEYCIDKLSQFFPRLEKITRTALAYLTFIGHIFISRWTLVRFSHPFTTFFIVSLTNDLLAKSFSKTNRNLCLYPAEPAKMAYKIVMHAHLAIAIIRRGNDRLLATDNPNIPITLGSMMIALALLDIFKVTPFLSKLYTQLTASTADLSKKVSFNTWDAQHMALAADLCKKVSFNTWDAQHIALAADPKGQQRLIEMEAQNNASIANLKEKASLNEWDPQCIVLSAKNSVSSKTDRTVRYEEHSHGSTNCKKKIIGYRIKPRLIPILQKNCSHPTKPHHQNHQIIRVSNRLNPLNQFQKRS